MRRLFTRSCRALVLLVVFLSGPALKALASHYAAVDLYVDFIGADSTNLTYRVTLQIYKACEGTNVSQADLVPGEPIQVSSTNSGVLINRTLQATSLHVASYLVPNPVPPFGHDPYDTLDQLCGSAAGLNLCRQPDLPSGPNYPGFVRATYIDTLTIPNRAIDWKFIWTSGARNATILNLSPNQGSIWCEAGLNNLEPRRWNNSTPRYIIPPVQYLCLNQPDQFLNGPVELPADAPYDSVYTVNKVPQDYGGVSFGYVPGYSLANPLAAAMPAGYVVDPNSGAAYFTPTVSGKFVIAFRTEEYARISITSNPHPLMGYVARDVQVAVLPCGTGGGVPPVIHLPPTQLTGGVLQADSIVSIPVNGAVALNISAKSMVSGGTVGLFASNALSAPGSQFTVTHPASDSAIGHFTWTPALSDTGSHVMAILAVDSSCNSGLLIPQAASRNLILKVYKPNGVGSLINPAGLNVWPNPAGKVLYLKGSDIRRAVLLSATGQLVAAYERPSGTLDISALAPGMYIVRLTTGSGTAYVRFIKE